jgi:phosphohistidine swiveling domain-containing protein
MREAMTYIDFDPQSDFEATPIWVWDASHSNPPWTPLFGWYWGDLCCFGGAGAMETVSLPRARTTHMRLFKGGIYYGFSLVEKEEEIKAREAKFREFIRPYIENGEEKFVDVLQKELMPEYQRLKKFDPGKMSNYELWMHVEDCLNVTRRMWYFHVLGMYVTWIPYVLLENTCKQYAGLDDRNPLFLKLITGFDNKTFEVDRKLWKLAQRAQDLGIGEHLSVGRWNEVAAKLGTIDAGRQWLSEFQAFLDEDGWRMPRRAEFIAPSWIEDPTPAIRIMSMYVAKGAEFNLEAQRAIAVKEREKAEKEVLEKIPEEEREYFKKLLTVAQQAGSYNEGHSYYCEDYCFSITRRAFIEIGRRYVSAGMIEKAEDIFFFLPEEIRKYIYYPRQYSAGVKDIIEKRKEEWEGWCREVMNPPFLLKEGVGPQDIAPHLIALRDPIFFKAILGTMPDAKPELKADFYGVTGSPGIAEGPARVIMNEKQLVQVQEGDILVAANTAPSWTPVFNLIKGAVIDIGGSLCHAAIVAREFGIPLVVNVMEGTRKIKTGQRLRVDANQGVVYILDK